VLLPALHVPIVVNHHPYWWAETDEAWQRALARQAAERSLPIWPAGRWLRFIEARRATRVYRNPGGFEVQVAGPGVTLDARLSATSSRTRSSSVRAPIR
jgi:hypothetical protein